MIIGRFPRLTVFVFVFVRVAVFVFVRLDVVLVREVDVEVVEVFVFCPKEKLILALTAEARKKLPETHSFRRPRPCLFRD